MERFGAPILRNGGEVMQGKNNFKRILSGIMSVAMAATLLPSLPAVAEDAAEKYPYTMFAASDTEGAITINANNFCVNGNIATNGTIVSSGNMNVNGTKTENADEEMIYILKKLNYSYFSGDNVETYADDYSFEDLNTWNALEDFGNDENALAVIDGSGSMYPRAIAVALSLGIYFAERNKGRFHNHFITFSERPQLVEIKGSDIAGKVEYCRRYSEVANTNISAVFNLLLKTAVKYNLPQEELPKRLYIISDMEFDKCADNAGKTNFECARRKYAEKGYTLPEIVFWNVESRKAQQPVTMNENGVALVSGCSPRLFSMVASGELNPYKAMLDTLMSERYAPISA